MKKLLLFTVIILFSCNEKKDVDSRIIYELSEKHSKFILKTFNDYYEASKLDEYNIKKQLVNVRDGFMREDYRYRFSFEEVKDSYNEYKAIKTNRFLKLSRNVFVPVIFFEDSLYERKDGL